MAALTATKVGDNATVVATVNTLTAADTMAYTAGAGAKLLLNNTTGSPLTLNLKGNLASSLSVKGYGTIDLTAGNSVAVAAGAEVVVNLDAISAWLAGTVVNLTGAAGLSAILLT